MPRHLLDKAKEVAISGGPAAVDRFLQEQGHPRPAAWCGAFAASVVQSQGLTPPQNPELASNWRKWGEPVKGLPQPGDVAVKAGVPTGERGSHVTFVESVDPERGTFTAVGGNQGKGLTKAQRMAGQAGRSEYQLGAFDFRHAPTEGATKQLTANAAPASLDSAPPPGEPGNVNVTLRQRNAPPGATMTASAEGNVTVGRPTTEYEREAA